MAEALQRQELTEQKDSSICCEEDAASLLDFEIEELESQVAFTLAGGSCGGSCGGSSCDNPFPL